MLPASKGVKHSHQPTADHQPCMRPGQWFIQEVLNTNTHPHRPPSPSAIKQYGARCTVKAAGGLVSKGKTFFKITKTTNMYRNIMQRDIETCIVCMLTCMYHVSIVQTTVGRSPFEACNLEQFWLHLSVDLNVINLHILEANYSFI